MSGCWIRRTWRQCTRHGGLLAAALTGTTAAVAVDLAMPLVVRAAVDGATGVDPGVALGAVVAALVVLAVLRYLGQFVRRVTAGRLALTVQHDLRTDLLGSVLAVGGRTADGLSTGQLVSRSITDLQLIQGILAMAPLALGAAVQVVLSLVVMAWLSPPLTLVALLIVPAVAVTVVRTRNRMLAATWTAQQAGSDLTQHVEETISGVRVVKGFGQEGRMVDELADHGRRLYARRLRVAAINGPFTATMSAIPQLGLVGVIGVGGVLALDGRITAGTLLAFATYVLAMTSLARHLTMTIVTAQLARASAERVYEIVDLPADPRPHTAGRVPEGPIGLRLRDVALSFPDADVLRGVTLDVAPGETVAVVGPPGSGKSLLASLAVGLYAPDAGAIALTTADGRETDTTGLGRDELRGAVGAVFDEPFLFSDTVAANIALGRPGASRDDIVDAARRAAADGFIRDLDDGYETRVGERGLTLSGGQRQRIALARALLSDARVLVLDDATSAVDAETEAAVHRSLTADGRTLLVLAHRASTLAHADRVAVLAEGRIAAVGTPAELAVSSPEFRALTTDRDDTASTMTDAALWPADPPLRPVDDDLLPELRRHVDALPPAVATPTIDDAEARRGTGGFSLRQVLRPVRALLLLTIALIGIDAVVSLGYPSLLRVTADAAADDRSGPVLAAALVGVVLVAIGLVASSVQTITAARAGEGVLYGLRVRSYAHLQRLGLDFFERELTGRILTRMTTDVDALSTFLQTGLAGAVVATLTVGGVAVALVATDPSLSLILLAVLPVLVVATIWFARVSGRAYTRSREVVSAVNADFTEALTGLRTVQAYRAEPARNAVLAARSAEYVAERMRAQRAISLYFPFITFAADLATAAVVGIGAAHLAAGSLSAGALVAFVLYLGMLFGPVQQLTQVFDGYQQAAVGLRRIGELLRTESSLRDDPDAPARPRPRVAADGHRTPGLEPAPQTGEVRLAGVGFRYTGARQEALHGVDLRIPAGGSLALVGPTGAGKSTIVKLIARFYDPTSGAVLLDGVDARGYRTPDLRARIGIVPQEPHLFTGTVADNIAFGRPDATRTEITAAAAAVGATDVIARLPGGMLHPIGERGRGLSAGQSQLIALARAELADPDVLLLDEATATLDEATESRVLAAGARLARTRTAVIVAHRLATAARADRIAVVAGGGIVEYGSHADLARAGGLYQRLWDAGESRTSVEPDAVVAELRPIRIADTGRRPGDRTTRGASAGGRR